MTISLTKWYFNYEDSRREGKREREKTHTRVNLMKL